MKYVGGGNGRRACVGPAVDTEGFGLMNEC